MKNKWVRITVISLGTIVLLLILANFGLNYWLQNNLPNYVKKNTDYTISYKNMEVDLGTGDIMTTGITINNINEKNDSILGLAGTIDSLKISRFGIYDALFNKTIHSSRLELVNPNLTITLPNSKNTKRGKKQNSLPFENLKVKKGNFTVLKSSKSKYFEVKNLYANFKNIELLEDDANQLLPFAFDEQEINGEHFYYRPDNLKIIKAEQIHTENKIVSIKNLEIIPLLSYAQFAKYYPKKANYFQGTISKIDFKDFLLKKDKISFATVEIQSPNLKLYTYDIPKEKIEKAFKNNLNLDHLKIINAHFEILKEKNNTVFSGKNLNLDISKLKMNEKTVKGKIPFTYDQFNITGKNVESIVNNQTIKIQSVSIQPLSVQLKNLWLKPIGNFNNKTVMDGSIKNIDIKIKEWKFIEGKLKLDVEDVIMNGLNGELNLSKKENKKKIPISGIDFPLTIRKISLKNSNLILSSKNKPLHFKNLNAEVRNLEMNAQTVKNKTPFKMGSYLLSASNFDYRLSEFYNANIGSIKINNEKMNLSNLILKPTVSRAEFVRRQPVEKDLYDLKIKQLTANGTWDFFSNIINVNANNVNIEGMNANIFRSKIPKDDLSEKPMYSSMLKKIKFPLYVGDLNIRNSTLVYEEDTPKSDGPGKLIFGNFNLNAKNINSGKSSGKPTKIPIVINTLLMNTSPLTVNWSFNTASNDDQFTISGYTGNMDAPRLNLFIEPYLKIRATGNISRLTFDFRGNKRVLNGTLKMEHQDLKVSVLNKKGEKDGVISAVANIFVKTDSGKFPESVLVENVERDNTKSFFNFLWKGLQEGLSKTLIGVGTVAKVETGAKTTGKPKTETKRSSKPEVTETPKTEKKEKKGFFERIFK